MVASSQVKSGTDTGLQVAKPGMCSSLIYKKRVTPATVRRMKIRSIKNRCNLRVSYNAPRIPLRDFVFSGTH